MKRTVYLETTIISYLAAWPSRDLVTAAHQSLTRDWWERRRMEYELYISRAVLEEARQGDPAAAARRANLLHGLSVLPTTERAIAFAGELVVRTGLPAKAGVDALHVAVAATNGIEVLLTWNCRHIAGANFRPRIELACQIAGLLPPSICTPLEFQE